MNPLDVPGTVFELELLNPNPTSSKTKEGPIYRVSFEVGRESWQCFMDACTKGMLIAARACVVGDSEDEAALEPKPKGDYGKQSETLWKSGFTRAPAVWRALGTDAEYLAWIRQQACCVCGTTQQIEAAHVRRIADGAGVGVKPDNFSAVPMCHRHHEDQHQHGESAHGGKEWFDKQRINHVSRWAWVALKQQIGVESMTHADPIEVQEWAKAHGVEQYLPIEYRA